MLARARMTAKEVSSGRGGAEPAQALFQAVDGAGAAAGERDPALDVLGEGGRRRRPLEPPQGGHRPAQRLEAGPAGGAAGEVRLGLPALAARPARRRGRRRGSRRRRGRSSRGLQQAPQLIPAAGDARADGADRDAGDLGDLLVGEAPRGRAGRRPRGTAPAAGRGRRPPGVRRRPAAARSSGPRRASATSRRGSPGAGVSEAGSAAGGGRAGSRQWLRATR